MISVETSEDENRHIDDTNHGYSNTRLSRPDFRLPVSHQEFERASRVIPGGVNSPARAFKAVGGVPPFISRGEGAYLFDVDGHAYIDYVGSWGPMILGHVHPAVREALARALDLGTSFGAPTTREIEIAELVAAAVPSVEKVRFVSSGTEAVMSAVRLARGVTGRAKIIKMAGHYHGHVDSLLVQAGSAATTLGTPNSPGVTAGAVHDTILCPFNDIAAVRDAIERFPGQVAAVLLEPIAGNMGLVPPRPGYLAALRELTQQDGSLLIFDEVMTGFRVAYAARRASMASCPTSRPWARSSGVDCPRRPTAPGLQSWTWSRRSVPSTRPGRFRAIPWRWPRASQPCACCETETVTSGSKPPARGWPTGSIAQPLARAYRTSCSESAAC